jgi:hypothetical protein
MMLIKPAFIFFTCTKQQVFIMTLMNMQVPWCGVSSLSAGMACMFLLAGW